MSSPAIMTLEDVEREQARAGLALRFSRDIEKLYNTESLEARRLFVVTNWIIGLVAYDSFIISDFLVSGHDFVAFAIGRFAVVTPLTLFMLLLIFKKSRFFDIMSCLIPILFTVSLSVLLIIGHGNYRINYLFGDILMIICGYVISRPPLSYSVVTVCIQCLCFLATMMFSDTVDPDGKAVSILFCLSGAIVTIMTAYALESSQRSSFLLGLRVRILNDQLRTMTMTDPLTGLGNRRMFEDATSRFWATAIAEPARASLVLIDIDLFKAFNDSQGHSAGDLCLTAVGGRIAASIREGDMAVRFGGEEIVIFLPDTDFTEARRLAETVRLAVFDLAIPHPALGANARVTASFGVATALSKDCSPDQLVMHADMALYAAKHNGRNQVWPPIGLAESSRSMPVEGKIRA